MNWPPRFSRGTLFTNKALLLTSTITLISSAVAQVSVSTSDSRCTGNSPIICTISQRESGPTPPAIVFSATGTGTPSMGTCTPGDPAWEHDPCSSGNDGFHLTFGGAAPTTGITTLSGAFNNTIPASLTPQLSWTVHINGCASGCDVKFILNVVAATPPLYKTPAGTISHECKYSDPTVYYSPDTCDLDNITPG